MLSKRYYAQNYAGIIGLGLPGAYREAIAKEMEQLITVYI